MPPGLLPLSLGLPPLPPGLPPLRLSMVVTAVDLVSRLVAVEGRVVDTCEPLSVVRGVTAVPWSLAALWLLVVLRVTVPLPLRLPVERVVAPLLLLLVVTVVGRLVEGLLT